MRRITNTKYLFFVSNLFLLCNHTLAEPLLKKSIINNQYESIYWEKIINFPVKNDLVWEKYLESKTQKLQEACAEVCFHAVAQKPGQNPEKLKYV